MRCSKWELLVTIIVYIGMPKAIHYSILIFNIDRFHLEKSIRLHIHLRFPGLVNEWRE